MALPSQLTQEYFLTAADTDAQGRMPMWLIVTRVIEVATQHANRLGVGYDELIKHGMGWVLSRLSIEMDRYLGINSPYKITTWIEGFNRLYSDRCFEITDASGTVVGNIRSMWVAIDIEKRTAADLSKIDRSRFVVSEPRCPVTRSGKQHPLSDDAIECEYTFKFCDLDFNRHVNTVQYVRHILNQWPLMQYDTHQIGRFDITFHHECHFGDTVKIRHIDNGDTSLCEIIDGASRQAVTASIRWQPTDHSTKN